MKSDSKFLKFIAFLFTLLLGLSSCIHEDFDEPPVGGSLIDLTANTTIANLKAKHRFGNFEKIEEDIIIEGYVIANDESGNYYKTIVIQDASGGIDVKINTTGLYNDYPEGQKVYVKCTDLYMSDYNGLIQLGGSTSTDDNGNLRLDGIEEALFPEHIAKGNDFRLVEPAVVAISDLIDARVSTLVKLEDVQFSERELGSTYADAVNKRSVNLTIEDCNKRSIVLRTSGYADFAAEAIPGGKGSIVGVYSVFGNTGQLYIRNTADILLTEDRCSGGTTTPIDTNGVSTLAEDFSALTNNQAVELSGWKNVGEKGSRTWLAKEFSGNTYAQASAFQANDPENVMWLISPKIILDQSRKLSFETAKAFWKHDGLSVWLSTDYNGSNLTSANWVSLNARLATKDDDDHAWIPSGDIDLTAYVEQEVYIGFRYVGDKASNTSTYRIDNIKVE